MLQLIDTSPQIADQPCTPDPWDRLRLAVEAVAHVGQCVAGARRAVELANADLEERAVEYAQAQRELQVALRAVRSASGEPAL